MTLLRYLVIMKSSLFSCLLIMLALFCSCNDDYRGRSGVRQQLVIPRGTRLYDSGFLSPAYTNRSTLPQNNNLSQPFTAQTDPLAAQALSQPQNMALSFDTAAMLLAKGLNPPHGYPGHRCDLKVGEALSLKPETKTTNQGLNPPHGQPGHRCDIAVGAPLNSKPVTNTIPTPQPNSATSEIMAPKNGLNPAHGQPGHRCDIAIGAPLNSKPLADVSLPGQNIPAPTNIPEDAIQTDSLKN